jgi:hypothetical protein
MSSTGNPFANDNLEHYDFTGIDYKKYSEGLKKALYNFMLGIGLDSNVQKWFEFKVPAPTVNKNLVNNFLLNNYYKNNELNACAIWLGSEPHIKIMDTNESSLSVDTGSLHAEWIASTKIIEWIKYISENCTINSGNRMSLLKLSEKFPGIDNEFIKFINSQIWNELRESALLLV